MASFQCRNVGRDVLQVPWCQGFTSLDVAIASLGLVLSTKSLSIPALGPGWTEDLEKSSLNQLPVR